MDLFVGFDFVALTADVPLRPEAVTRPQVLILDGVKVPPLVIAPEHAFDPS
jgi:hypothetical protein